MLLAASMRGVAAALNAGNQRRYRTIPAKTFAGRHDRRHHRDGVIFDDIVVAQALFQLRYGVGRTQQAE